MHDGVAMPRNPDYAAAVRDSFARQGLLAAIGASLVAIEPGRVVIELPYRHSVTQQRGLFHGGVIGAAGDAAAGYAAMSLLPAGSEVLTVEYKVNFMRPAKGALLRAIGEVVRSGRTISVARAEVTCSEGAAMAMCGLLQATMMRVEARADP